MRQWFNSTFALLLVMLSVTSCIGRTSVTVEVEGRNFDDDYIEEWITIDFEYLQDARYDMMGMVLRTFSSVDEWNGELYLNFDAAMSQESFDFYAEMGCFDISIDFDFDFENYVLLITYGRELVELEGVGHIRYGSGSRPEYRYCVTYGTKYHEDTVFFYITLKDDNIRLLPPRHEFHSYLLQEDGEKVYFFTGKLDPETWNGPYYR